MKIYLILSCISLTSATRTSKFVGAGFVDTMYLSQEVSEPMPENIYSATHCGLKCTNLPSKKCTRFRFCQQEVGKAGNCTMYQSGEKCIMGDNGGPCSCFMVESIMEDVTTICTCPVGIYGSGPICCKLVIKDCTTGEQLQTLKGRGKMLAFIKPDGYSGDPFEVVCRFGSGGRTLISSRLNTGSILNFNRPWIDYVQGFGNTEGSFWLGFNKIAALLKNGLYRLFITLKHNGDYCTLEQDFRHMGTSAEDFPIDLNLKTVAHPAWCTYFVNNRNFSGVDFSTPDNDKSGCVATMQSGWWFDATCNNLNLHAPYNNDTPPTITVSQGQPQLEEIVFDILRIHVYQDGANFIYAY